MTIGQPRRILVILFRTVFTVLSMKCSISFNYLLNLPCYSVAKNIHIFCIKDLINRAV